MKQQVEGGKHNRRPSYLVLCDKHVWTFATSTLFYL